MDYHPLERIVTPCRHHPYRRDGGAVKRTEGMFSGATMEDVENDYDTEMGAASFRGKRRIKDTFHRTQEEAQGMFERVKRSFSDFINRE